MKIKPILFATFVGVYFITSLIRSCNPSEKNRFSKYHINRLFSSEPQEINNLIDYRLDNLVKLQTKDYKRQTNLSQLFSD